MASSKKRGLCSQFSIRTAALQGFLRVSPAGLYRKYENTNIRVLRRCIPHTPGKNLNLLQKLRKVKVTNISVETYIPSYTCCIPLYTQTRYEQQDPHNPQQLFFSVGRVGGQRKTQNITITTACCCHRCSSSSHGRVPRSSSLIPSSACNFLFDIFATFDSY